MSAFTGLNCPFTRARASPGMHWVAFENQPTPQEGCHPVVANPAGKWQTRGAYPQGQGPGSARVPLPPTVGCQGAQHLPHGSGVEVVSRPVGQVTPLHSRGTGGSSPR